jgi:hypothetical protein
MLNTVCGVLWGGLLIYQRTSSHPAELKLNVAVVQQIDTATKVAVLAGWIWCETRVAVIAVSSI